MGVVPSDGAWKRVVASVRKTEKAGGESNRRRPPAPFIPSRLAVADEDIAAGGTGTFSFYVGDAGSESDSTQDVEAYDWLKTGIVQGRRAQLFWANGAWYFITRGYTFAYGLTTAAVAAADSTFTIDAVEGLAGGETPDDDPLTVQNTFAWDCDDNAPCIAIYRPSNDTWLAHQLLGICPEE